MVQVSHLAPGEEPVERCNTEERTTVVGPSAEAVVPFFGTELNASGRMPPEVGLTTLFARGTLAEAPEAKALSPWAA
jgi:hypothetical protein